MNPAINELLVNLKIISKIPENGRIKRCEKLIALEDSNVKLFWIKRFISGDSRKKAITDITDIISYAIEKCDDIVNSKFFEGHSKMNINDSFVSKKMDIEYQKHYEILELIYNELKTSIIGLMNLKTTYHDDATIVAKIDILLSRIKNHLKDLEKRSLHL
jgi:hypothetical protein